MINVNDITNINNCINKFVFGNSLDFLKKIPDKFVDMCITSPPYYKQRDYGFDFQIGQEESLERIYSKFM